MVRVQSTGPTSIQLPVLGKPPVTLRRDEWLEMSAPDDLRYVLAPTPNGAVMRADRTLAPYRLTTKGAEPVTVKCRIDWEEVHVGCVPGQWTEVDRVAHHNLRRKHDVVRIQTPTDLLSENPSARILIQRDGGLGDLLFMTAAVRALLRKFPDARLYLATKQSWKALMARTGLFEDVFDFAECYDHAPFDMDCDVCNLVETHPRRMDDIRFDIFADAFGTPCDGDYKMVCKPAETSAHHLLPEDLRNPVAIDLQGSSWVRRPTPAYCVELITLLAQEGFTPVGVMFPNPTWWPAGVGVDLNGCSSEDLFSVMNNTATVSVDTGTLHAAIALGSPTVGLFGPIASNLRVDSAPKVICLDSPEQCTGCVANRGRCSVTTNAQCFDQIPQGWITDSLRQVTGWR